MNELRLAKKATRAAPNVAAVVYLTALMLPDGMSAMDLPTIMAEEGFEGPPSRVGFALSTDGLSILPPENALEVFYSECSEEDRIFAGPRIGSEPLAPVMTKLSLSASRSGSLPRIYIETTRDEILPIEAQRAMIARCKPTEVHSLDADHMPIFNEVDRLAELLDSIAVRVG